MRISITISVIIISGIIILIIIIIIIIITLSSFEFVFGILCFPGLILDSKGEGYRCEKHFPRI